MPNIIVAMVLLLLYKYIHSTLHTHVPTYTGMHPPTPTHTHTHRAHSCQYKHVPTAHSDTYNIATVGGCGCV